MLRVLILSDLHYHGEDVYGITPDERLEMLIEDINKENEKGKVDCILMLGDYSLDFWIKGGSYLSKKISNTEQFFKNFLHRLPCPVYFIPGNHEQYDIDKWQEISGCEREQFSVILGKNVFVMLDNYALDLNPIEHVDGTYSYSDVNFIKSALNQHPDKQFFLCAHEFEYESEKAEFKELVKNEDRIVALFAGHTHTKESICLGRDYGNKFLFRTGQYVWDKEGTSEHKKWGFRNLQISDDGFFTEFLCER